ncbi:MAG TPA: MFS transporter [Lapillicoccus sp.]|nr:MFS transporter [Lapillicoccus sp.]
MATSAAPDARPTLRSFWTDLPREGKFLLSTIIIDFIGNGLVMPFNVVYLHEVRGFELARVGLLLALPALVGLLVVGPVGALIDRIGPRLVVIGSLVIQVTAHIVLASATTELRAAIGCILLGFSGGIIWPAIQTLVGTIIPTHLRQRYFGVNFTLLNLGIGIGGILGGLFVDVNRPETFVAIYLIDAATFLAPLAIFLGPLRHVRKPVRPPADDGGEAPRIGYRTVFRDRSLLLVLLIVFVGSFVGYGQLNTGIPAFGREVGGISTQALGLAFAANTAVIVVLQLFVLQRIEGRRRTRMLVLMSGIWALSFLALGATGLVPGTIVAAMLFGLCAAVFGFGETFYQPTLPAMVNDLAPDHLRGRYNAVMSIAWQSASVVGPVVAGVLIGHGWTSSYIGMLVGGCVVVAWLALVAERRLPPRVNGVRDDEDAVPEAPVVPGQA